jgi:hypothetical protein
MVKSSCLTSEVPTSQARRGVHRNMAFLHLTFIRFQECSGREWTRFLDSIDLGSNKLNSNSSISPVYWRSQRIVLHSLKQNTTLSAFNISTGLTTPPTRGLPSPFIPRSSSFVFHPTQMIYANGGPDGSGMSGFMFHISID